jgi:hypothetical protein
VVADRGMICAETMAELEARRLLYILGVRERSDNLVRELVLDLQINYLVNRTVEDGFDVAVRLWGEP